MKDRIQLAVWLKNKASLAEVEQADCFGLVENERFTERARDAFRLLWSWSVPRFAGRAGSRQERAYERLGPQGLNRRFERANRIAERLSAA